eukprot:CCRYP_018443-RA/>CCRYP_018443-RA protein AED:0.42 eAED:0.42 QI:0/0/0/1/0/0/2/0/220
MMGVALMSQYQANPREGHLEALYLIFHYLWKNPLKRIVFDHAVPRVDENQFHLDDDWTKVLWECGERGTPRYASPPLGSQSQSIPLLKLIMLAIALIKTFSRRQNTVEASTYGSEMVAMRLARDIIVEMHIKLKMFDVPITGAANVYCSNKGVVSNTSIPESTLSKKHNSINYHVIHKSVAAGIMCVAKENTLTNLADVFTKLLPFLQKSELLYNILYDR